MNSVKRFVTFPWSSSSENSVSCEGIGSYPLPGVSLPGDFDLSCSAVVAYLYLGLGRFFSPINCVKDVCLRLWPLDNSFIATKSKSSFTCSKTYWSWFLVGVAFSNECSLDSDRSMSSTCSTNFLCFWEDLRGSRQGNFCFFIIRAWDRRLESLCKGVKGEDCRFFSFFRLLRSDKSFIFSQFWSSAIIS